MVPDRPDDPNKAPDADPKPVVYVISDALGETAERVARAALRQFASVEPVRLVRVSYVNDAERVRNVLNQARRHRSLIVYTLIIPELRALLAQEAAAANIPAVDLMGPILNALGQLLHTAPKLMPGLMHQLDEEYYRRIEAVEFAVKYDDGRDPRGLLEAHIVLIGVSRTSKTPVSMYLAHRCHKVANVPLIPEMDPPRELFEIEPRKIVGLIIQPEHLAQIRQQRLRSIGLDQDAVYGDLQRIREELLHARRVFARLGCAVIDVTNMAVEETAGRVLEAVYQGENGVRFDR